eukprot:TRINITY_DN27184_c0_g1_i1.p1 TRINITY_DN27184_c0_g1~~TRINITY_DN27184_c0_g1_i1.p1  ORF type:complete len:212 (-),score=46.69 TRINITY_DN27184_c0_g1_i1:1049-1630(-)
MNGMHVEELLEAATAEANGNGHLLDNPEEAFILVQRILQSYRVHTSTDLLNLGDIGGASRTSGPALLTAFWEHPDAIICVAWKPPTATPALVFANQAGLDMMETSTNALLAEVPWERTYGEDARKSALSALSMVTNSGSTVLGPGVRLSCNGRAASYERCIVWKVVSKEDQEAGSGSSNTCIAFMHQGWRFMT